MKGYMPDFELQNDIYLYEGEPCKIFLPAVILEAGKYYWIQYVRDGQVTITHEDTLELPKRGKLLYGKKE